MVGYRTVSPRTTMCVMTTNAPSRSPERAARLTRFVPGLALAAGAAGLSMLVSDLLQRVGVPSVSPLIIAIVLGIVLTNVVALPEATGPGITFAAKKLLRAGIVLLGLQLVMGDILSLGAPMLVVIVVVVAGGVFATLGMGRLLGMKPAQTLLIACGFSICGAAAVAGVEGVTDADEEEVVTAVALVVIFGTLMIAVIPFLSSLFGLGPELAGMWAGASIHEIAQVVAAGGLIGGGALAVAVVVKLARVLLLAPIVAVLSIRQRRLGTLAPGAKRPPIVPLFIIGFLAMVALRSSGWLPEGIVQAGGIAQTALLSAAMFGLGCGVKVRSLMSVGAKPFVLATGSTLVVASLSLAGIVLVHS